MIEAMRHSCTITRSTSGTADSYGVPAKTSTTSSAIRCRFINPKGSMKKLESGEHVYNLPIVILPAGTTVSEGDLVTGITAGFARTYKVMHVSSVPADEGISHLHCDIEAVT